MHSVTEFQCAIDSLVKSLYQYVKLSFRPHFKLFIERPAKKLAFVTFIFHSMKSRFLRLSAAVRGQWPPRLMCFVMYSTCLYRQELPSSKTSKLVIKLMMMIEILTWVRIKSFVSTGYGTSAAYD